MSAPFKRWVVGSAGAMMIAGSALAQAPTTQPSQQPTTSQPATPQAQQQQAQQQQAQQQQAQKAQPLPDQAQGQTISQVRKLATDFQEAWNADDTKALSQLFTNDAGLLAPDGESAVGRNDIQAFFGRELAGSGKGSRMTVKVETVRQLRPDLVVVDTMHTIEGGKPMPGMPAGPQDVHAVLVTQRQGGKWLLKEVRAMPVPAQQVGIGGAGSSDQGIQQPPSTPPDQESQPMNETQPQPGDVGGSGIQQPPSGSQTGDTGGSGLDQEQNIPGTNTAPDAGSGSQQPEAPRGY